MMSHLTRFDSEMHEDKDDLETTRESKRSQIIAPTTELEVSVDGTSADRKVRFHPHVPIVLSLILAPKLNFYHFCTLETNPSTHANQQSLRWPKLLSRGPRVKHLLPTPANQRKKVRTKSFWFVKNTKVVWIILKDRYNQIRPDTTNTSKYNQILPDTNRATI